ncbi:MAG: hypothetical protein ACE14P_12360 [Methanotrichaceae archaeon]
MRIKSKIMYTLIFLLLGSQLGSSGLGVSGAILERKVDPGEIFSHEMIVSSDSSTPPMDLTIDILGINQTVDGENVELKEGEDIGPYSARTFLKAIPEIFHLEPGESQKVTVEGRIPYDARPGGRYALINIHSLPIGNETIGIIVAVEVPVRLTISGPGLKKSGRIEDIRLEEPISARQQNISLTLRNTGNYHYKARAYAELKDIKGNTIADDLSPLSSNIIAGASRIFRLSTASKKELGSGTYFVNATVKLINGSILDTKEVQFNV